MNLLECHIAGLPHRQPPLVPEAYPPIGALVRLELEPDNKFDPSAIRVFYGETFLGYIPKVETPTCRHFGFERGTMTVTSNNGKKWKEITIVKEAPSA